MKQSAEKYKSLHLRLAALLVFISLILQNVCAGKEVKVFIVKSKDITSYNLAVEGFQSQSPAEWNIVEYNLGGTLKNIDKMQWRLEKEKPDLAVAVGAKALAALTELKISCPAVFCMVINPRAFDIQVLNSTGVSLMVSPEEQLKTLLLLNPKFRKIGVLLRKQTSPELLRNIKSLALRYDVEIKPVEIGSEKEIPRKIRGVLGRIDALWMLDDSFIYDKETLDFVILKSLENEIAFMAISRLFVREGALVSLSPSFSSNGAQASQIAQEILVNNVRPRDISMSFHRNPDLVINLKIARKIGLEIPPVFLDKAKVIYE